MRVKVKGNLSGAVQAIKDQEITVSAEQGRDLIGRGLAVEIAPAKRAPKSEPKRADKAGEPEL